MAVYGNMLLAFPELLKFYELFKMKPLMGGGYGERYDKRRVRGYWTWRKSGKTEIEEDLRLPDHRATFWVQDDFLTKKPLIEREDFVEIGKELFKVVQNDNFSHEAGFTKCLMQVVAGVTDRQVSNKEVDEVIANDY